MYCAESLQRAVQENDASHLRVVCKLVNFQKLKSSAGPDDEDSELFQSSVDEDSINDIQNFITELQALLQHSAQTQ